ncbi:nuclear transport factor 2 family protein [Dactylosporangium sp. CA-152071]|uniref:nuclear transport factor 2 family protein n=1 Tax=Dactylosporangium sp. CA-152071 TaxID=3239933 RepID=UPI003D9240D0
MTAPLLLRRGTVVDTRDGSLRPGTDVLADGGVITAVGEGLDAPRGATVVDVSGRYVVPGYNDMHAHPLGHGDPAPTLELMLAHGITGFRQMHGDLGLLRARAAGELRLSAAAPALLAMPGPLLTMLNTGTAEQAAATVREQVAAGADFVKSAAMSKERFFDAQAEALRLGVPIVGHLPAGIDVLRASSIGMKSVEHFGSGLGVLACCSTDEPALREASGARSRLRLPPARLPFMDRVVAAVMRRVVLNPVLLNKAEDVEILDRAVRTFDEHHAHDLAARFAADGTWHVPTLIRQKTSKFCDDPSFAADEDLRYMAAATRRTWDRVAARFGRFTLAHRHAPVRGAPGRDEGPPRRDGGHVSDVAAAGQVVLLERQARDRGWWDQMRACYWPDSTVGLSWYTGDGPGFVDASRAMAAAGNAGVHRLSPPVVQVVGDRAFAEVPAAIEVRTDAGRTAAFYADTLRWLSG